MFYKIPTTLLNYVITFYEISQIIVIERTTYLQGTPNKRQIASSTMTTAGGGEWKDLISAMVILSREFTASIAAKYVGFT